MFHDRLVPGKTGWKKIWRPRKMFLSKLMSTNTVGGLEIQFLLKWLKSFSFGYTHQHLISHPPLIRKCSVPAVRGTVGSGMFAQGHLDSFTGLGRHHTDRLHWTKKKKKKFSCCFILDDCIFFYFLYFCHISQKWDFRNSCKMVL